MHADGGNTGSFISVLCSKGPFTYYVAQGGGGLLIFVTKCDKG